MKNHLAFLLLASLVALLFTSCANLEGIAPRVVGHPIPEPDVLGGPAEPRVSSDRPVRDFVDNLRFRVGLSGKGIAGEAVLPNDFGAGLKLYLVTPIDSEIGPIQLGDPALLPPPPIPVK